MLVFVSSRLTILAGGCLIRCQTALWVMVSVLTNVHIKYLMQPDFAGPVFTQACLDCDIIVIKFLT